VLTDLFGFAGNLAFRATSGEGVLRAHFKKLPLKGPIVSRLRALVLIFESLEELSAGAWRC